VRQSHAHQTVADAYRRFLQLHPEYIEDACEYFVAENATKIAAYFITKLLVNPHFESLNNRNKYFWWSKLSDLIGLDPDIENAEQLLLNGCRDFVVETGRMWVLVGEHFARLGRFADAIQTFEDALNSTNSARDFAIVFEGASQLLLSVVTMSSFRMYEKKLNDLLDRRDLLLNMTLLRENRNNVECWIQRGWMFLDREYAYDPQTRRELWASLRDLTEQSGQINVFAEAIESVDPKRACEGRYCDLWISLSMLLDAPAVALEAALADDRLTASDLVGVYQHYAELELEGRRDMRAAYWMLQGRGRGCDRNASRRESRRRSRCDLKNSLRVSW
jgi:pre-mRNA-splicing factor SYF1